MNALADIGDRLSEHRDAFAIEDPSRRQLCAPNAAFRSFILDPSDPRVGFEIGDRARLSEGFVVDHGLSFVIVTAGPIADGRLMMVSASRSSRPDRGSRSEGRRLGFGR